MRVACEQRAASTRNAPELLWAARTLRLNITTHISKMWDEGEEGAQARIARTPLYRNQAHKEFGIKHKIYGMPKISVVRPIGLQCKVSDLVEIRARARVYMDARHVRRYVQENVWCVHTYVDTSDQRIKNVRIRGAQCT